MLDRDGRVRAGRRYDKLDQILGGIIMEGSTNQRILPKELILMKDSNPIIVG